MFHKFSKPLWLGEKYTSMWFMISYHWQQKCWKMKYSQFWQRKGKVRNFNVWEHFLYFIKDGSDMFHHVWKLGSGAGYEAHQPFLVRKTCWKWWKSTEICTMYQSVSEQRRRRAREPFRPLCHYEWQNTSHVSLASLKLLAYTLQLVWGSYTKFIKLTFQIFFDVCMCGYKNSSSEHKKGQYG